MRALTILAAILLPPLGVFLVTGLSSSFWISVALTLIGFLPGMAFALYTVLTDQRTIA